MLANSRAHAPTAPPRASSWAATFSGAATLSRRRPLSLTALRLVQLIVIAKLVPICIISIGLVDSIVGIRLGTIRVVRPEVVRFTRGRPIATILATDVKVLDVAELLLRLLLRLLPRLLLRQRGLLLTLMLLPLPQRLLQELLLRRLGRLLLLRGLRQLPLLLLQLLLSLRLWLGRSFEVRNDGGPSERPLPREIEVKVDELLKLIRREATLGDLASDLVFVTHPLPESGGFQVGRSIPRCQLAPLTRDNSAKPIGVFRFTVIALDSFVGRQCPIIHRP